VDFADHMVAVEPLMLAERDRAFLRQLRHNRNIERNLMQNVPDWQVGTLWGKPIFKNVSEEALPNVSMGEFLAHRANLEMKDHRHINKEIVLQANNPLTSMY